MIIGLCGKKQSGKNTVSNIFHGIYLKSHSMVKDFNISGDGKLYVCGESFSWGEFDVTRTDEEFLIWAEQNMHPYIKNYSFADPLKIICHTLFGLTKEQCWGNDNQKNTIVQHLLWENMPVLCSGMKYHNPGPMTAREFLQYFATEIMRAIYEPIWVNATINKIKQEKSSISIITDVRFLNEIESIRNSGGVLIKLTRDINKDSHSSENSLNGYDKYDYIIDNNKENFTVEDLIEESKKIYQKIRGSSF
jgi:hypothetical protein